MMTRCGHGRRWRLWAPAALALGCLGMGTLGGRDLTAPQVNFTAVFVDRDGTEVRCDRVSAAGQVHLNGLMGRGSLRIPFENIGRVSFAGGGGDTETATVELRNGAPVDLTVRGSLSFYGHTDVGLYQIRARELRSVQFVHE